MRMRRQLWGVGLGVALCWGAAWAGDTGTQQQQREGRQVGEAVQDKLDLLQQLAFVDQTQIALGRLAQEKSTDSSVRAFARGLVQDHEQHLDELQTYAELNDVELGLLNLNTTGEAVGGSGPADAAAGQGMEKRAVKYNDAYVKQVNAFSITHGELAALSGKDFDKAFLEQVANYQKQGQKLVDKGLGQFRDDASFALLLDRLVPLLQNHQTQAASLVKALDTRE